MNDVAVIYIAHAAYGINSLRVFLDAHRRFDGGVKHDLVIAFKGFGPRDHLQDFEELAAAAGARFLHFPDGGYDIGTYRHSALRSPNPILCFLNSSSEPLCDGWLAGLVACVSQSGVGLAGSTASYESNTSNVVRHWRDFPYRNQFDRTARTTWYALWWVRMSLHFPLFPNPHVRTNGFAMRRELFLDLVRTSHWSKWTTRYLESGHHSLTRKVRRAGLRALIVGRDGRAYDVDEWPQSGTFRAHLQENLTIADNQTRGYLAASPAMRQRLTECAWGLRKTSVR